MHNKVRKILMVGAAVAVALTATAAGAGAARRDFAQAPSCAISEMQAQMYDAGLLALGNHGLMLTLTNVSTHTCQVNGYPSLRMEDSAHRVLRTDVHEGATYFNDDPGPRVVELSPGERASAVLAWGAPDGVSDVRPAYLRIYLAEGATDFLRVAFQPGNVTNAKLTVTALAAHTPLRR
jgi:hypothetical protein